MFTGGRDSRSDTVRQPLAAKTSAQHISVAQASSTRRRGAPYILVPNRRRQLLAGNAVGEAVYGPSQGVGRAFEPPDGHRTRSIEIRELSQELRAIDAEAAQLQQRREQVLQRRAFLSMPAVPAEEDSESEVDRLLFRSLTPALINYNVDKFEWSERMAIEMQRTFSLQTFKPLQVG